MLRACSLREILTATSDPSRTVKDSLLPYAVPRAASGEMRVKIFETGGVS